MRNARDQRVALTATIERPDYFEKTESLAINPIRLSRHEQERLALLLGVIIFALASFAGFVTEILPEPKYNLLVSSLTGLTMMCLALAVITLNAKKD